MLPQRWILHADMDAFYASIEQRDDPALRGRPVIVGATSARGVVAAASYEARRYGVRSAMPGFRARQLCPDGVFLACNMPHYAAVSRQIHAVFGDFTPLVEPLALDEAFLDVGGSKHLFGGVGELGRELKRRVYEATQLTVSVGLAPSKLVAKIACTLGKPDGLRIVEAAEVRSVMDPLAVKWLWGVGPVLQRRLAEAGIETLAQLAAHDSVALERLVGRRGPELQALARGEDTRPVQVDRLPKSYGEENTFEQDASSESHISDVLQAHADAVARRLRRDGYRGRTVTLKIKLARAERQVGASAEPHYPLLTRSKTMSEPTDDGLRIASIARQLWRLADVQQPIRLLGVSLSGLESVPASGRFPAQLSLFEPNCVREPLGPTLDAINARFGAQVIQRAVGTPHKITHGRGIKRGET
jgi:DNA polymerase IV